MRLLIFLAISLVACSDVAERENVKMMQQVEKNLQLPRGVENLKYYARYYSKDKNLIVAIYIKWAEPGNPYYDLPIGHRRWLNSHRDLPSISDGGCSIVNVVYDPKAPNEAEVFCNGVA